MKLIFFLVFFIPCTLSNFAIDIVEIRNMFYSASESADKTEEFMEYMNNVKESNPLLKGYKAMACLLMAKNSFNPIKKWNYFSKGKLLLESAINDNNMSIELRFLRFSAQLNAPTFLNYSSNVKEDKKMIIKSFSLLTDTDLKVKIVNFLLENKVELTD
jgi:hypothetical protein